MSNQIPRIDYNLLCNNNQDDNYKELKKLIQAEKNKQLNQFSRIYFSKSKISYIINEK